MWVGYPVQSSWLRGCHYHAHELLAGPFINRVNSSWREPPVILNKLTELLVDIGILMAKKHPTYSQLPLNVDKADLPGFPSFLTFLVNVSHTWRWGQDQRLHVAFLPMDLLFWAVGSQSNLGKLPDGWGLDPWRWSVRHLITNSDGHIQEKTFIRIICLSRLLELLAIFPKVILEALQLTER